MNTSKEREKGHQYQNKELKFWTSDPIFYKKLSEITRKDVSKWFGIWQKRLKGSLDTPMTIFNGKDVIEIGFGSRGLINMIPGDGKRVGIDPLLHEYEKHGILFKWDKVKL